MQTVALHSSSTLMNLVHRPRALFNSRGLTHLKTEADPVEEKPFRVGTWLALRNRSLRIRFDAKQNVNVCRVLLGMCLLKLLAFT